MPLNLLLSIVLALMLNRRLPATNLFRAIFYLPTICTGVASYITWLYLYNPNFGFINVLLSRLGIQGPGWLSDINTAMPSLILMDMFVCGTSMTVVLASLQDTPKMYYEAANLDGANKWQQFVHVTFPHDQPGGVLQPPDDADQGTSDLHPALCHDGGRTGQRDLCLRPAPVKRSDRRNLQ